MKKKLLTVLAGAMVAGATLAGASSASAYVVCNADGDCWHTHAAYMRPGWQRHPDDWYFHRTWAGDPRWHYREYHEGRGYWRGGAWVPLP